MPPTLEEFPYEVQAAFFIYGLLPDLWIGQSGTYQGKDWAPIKSLLDIYQIENIPVVFNFVSDIQKIYTKDINERIERERKAQERKSKVGGKKYAHNVRS